MTPQASPEDCLESAKEKKLSIAGIEQHFPPPGMLTFRAHIQSVYIAFNSRASLRAVQTPMTESRPRGGDTEVRTDELTSSRRSWCCLVSCGHPAGSSRSSRASAGDARLTAAPQCKSDLQIFSNRFPRFGGGAPFRPEDSPSVHCRPNDSSLNIIIDGRLGRMIGAERRSSRSAVQFRCSPFPDHFDSSKVESLALSE